MTSEEELRIDLAKDKEVRVDLTRDAPDKRGWTTDDTNHVILKKNLNGKRSNSNTYVKIPHQSDEGAEE